MPHLEALSCTHEQLQTTNILAAIQWVGQIDMKHSAQPGTGTADSKADADVT